MEFLWNGLLSITWQQVVMYAVGLLLIYLAIEKDYEPALLLPMGFGAILVNIPFSARLPLSPLHWLIADQTGAIVVEAMREGLKIYEDPVGVLTNEPPFDYQMFHLNNHMQLTREAPRNSFAEGLSLKPYCLGMGALGLPGDLSSASRFVRAAFTKFNAVSGPSEAESVGQFFHILGSVAQTRGCARAADDRFEITVYSSCCNMDRGVYYYTYYL